MYLFKESLEFSKCICFWTNINTIFVFVLIGGPKNILENIWDYVWVWKKGTRKDSSCCSVVSKVALKMLFTCNNNKEECDVNTRKHMILFHKRNSLIEKVLFKSINKAITRQASFLYFGESVHRLNSSQKLCVEDSKTMRNQHHGQKFKLSCWTIDAFQFPKHSILICFKHD